MLGPTLVLDVGLVVITNLWPRYLKLVILVDVNIIFNDWLIVSEKVTVYTILHFVNCLCLFLYNNINLESYKFLLSIPRTVLPVFRANCRISLVDLPIVSQRAKTVNPDKCISWKQGNIGFLTSICPSAIILCSLFKQYLQVNGETYRYKRH